MQTVVSQGPATCDDFPHGEQLDIVERLVVAPAGGVFRPDAPDIVTAEGEVVAVGQRLGRIETLGSSEPVQSAFAGFLMGMLAREGDRVRAGQPVFWLRRL